MVRSAPRGSPLPCLRWLTLALGSGAERCAWDPFFLLLGLRAVDIGVVTPWRRLAHRLPGVFYTHSSLRIEDDRQPSPSHQSLHRLAGRTMLLFGLSSSRSRTSVLSAFTSDAPSV